MKKITMLALVASVLEFASSDATFILWKKKVKIPEAPEVNVSSIVNKQSHNKPMLMAFELPSLSRLILPWRSDDPRGNMIVPTNTIEGQKRIFAERCNNLYLQALRQYQELYGVQNGFVGMKRDIALRLAEIIRSDDMWDEKFKAIFGISDESFQWKDHAFFKTIQRRAFPDPLSIRYANSELEGFFRYPNIILYYHWNEIEIFNELILKGKTLEEIFSWEQNNRDKFPNNILPGEVSPNELIDICNSPNFKWFDSFKQASYLMRLHQYVEDGKLTVNQLRRIPHSVLLCSLNSVPLRKKDGISDVQLQSISPAYFERGSNAYRFDECKDRLTGEQRDAMDRCIRFINKKEVWLFEWGWEYNEYEWYDLPLKKLEHKWRSFVPSEYSFDECKEHLAKAQKLLNDIIRIENEKRERLQDNHTDS